MSVYRFRIALSDVDRGIYEQLDLRTALHQSENEAFLLTRVIAYALSYEDGLAFGPGLCDPDEPAIAARSPEGTRLWIEIGNPSARRLHKAAKAARALRVFTYKDPEPWLRELAGEQIHRAAEIGIFALDPAFLGELASTLERDNSWTLVHQTGELILTAGEKTLMGTVRALRL
jgi:uncharacterized protein YaeQ